MTQNILLGSWKIDKEASKKMAIEMGTPEQMAEFMITMIGNVKVDVTETRVNIFLGTTEMYYDYTIISDADGKMVLEGKTADSLIPKKLLIEVIDPTHIKFCEEGKEEQTMMLEKEK